MAALDKQSQRRMEGSVLKNHFWACFQLWASENTWPEPTLYGVLSGGCWCVEYQMPVGVCSQKATVCGENLADEGKPWLVFWGTQVALDSSMLGWDWMKYSVSPLPLAAITLACVACKVALPLALFCLFCSQVCYRISKGTVAKHSWPTRAMLGV